MDIDLSQFKQVFFEEAIEALSLMESELVRISVANPESEIIDNIFRAAHSIKGGSATFAYTQIADFTHLLETLLDEIRSETRELTAEHVSLLLDSVDIIRNMFEAINSNTEFSDPKLANIELQFIQLLNTSQETSIEQEDQLSTKTADNSSNSWRITFIPCENIMRYGNDPAAIINELKELGELEVTLLVKEWPTLHDFDPEACYLQWELLLTTKCSIEDIKAVFEWVEAESTINYQSLNALNTDKEPQKTAQDNTANQANITEAKTQSNNTSTSSIRVSTDKIDMLINLVGELVITQSMLGEISQQSITPELITELQQGLEQLESHTKELQESVMQIRMLPISFAFNRFPRLVRDTSMQLQKKAQLIITGESTELDKTVMEKIIDPMVHLVRNALDHGLESPEQRLAQNKNEIGTINLNAYHQGGNIVIEISDDGSGINPEKVFAKAMKQGLITNDDQLTESEIQQLIFSPGFSTVEEVSEISGRGVGMDVVKKNIASLNGSIELKSKVNEGSCFTIRLPLTLAILDGQLARVGQQTYIVPLVSIQESLQVNAEQICQLDNNVNLISVHGEYIPIVKMFNLFNQQPDSTNIQDGLIMIVNFNNTKFGLLFDELLTQQQIVIKSLEKNYFAIPGISGATILGNGKVALIIDVAGLIGSTEIKHNNFAA